MSQKNSNEIAASTQISNTYIMQNNILRNVYQIGFNSRNITKTITNNLEIKEISSNIIKNNIISVRSYGPLLLGLVLIYKKKIILFIEDLFNTLKPKLHNNINNNNFIDDDNSNHKKQTQSEIKLKLNSENFNIMSLTPIKHENTFFNKNNDEDENDNKYYNNIFTPDKKKAAKDLLTMDSNEMLRRSINNSLLTDKINSIQNSINNNNNDGSINNLSSLLQKEKLKKPLTETKPNNNKKNSLLINNNFNDSNFFDNNNNNDDFNFFNFINIKNENEINNNFNNNNNDFIDFTDTSNVFDNVFNMKEKTTITKHTFKEIDSIFTIKEKKQKPFVFKNKNLEFDEEISLPIKNIQEYTKENNFDIDDITNKFKNNLILQNKTLDTSNLEAFNNQSKYEYLAPSFIVFESENENNSIETKRNNELSFSNNNFNVSNFLISEKKKISIGSFSNVGKDLINDLSKLNLDKDDFDGILFDEKIEEIEKKNNQIDDNNNNQDDVNNFNENFNNDFIDDNVNFNNNDENDDEINYSNIKENINKKEINELFKEINNNILSKKKKEINFPNLSKKIKKCDNSNINENNIPQTKLFYDLLVLAQLGKIDINQKEIFNNESINIKIN